ncbi:cuticle protein AM1159-like [Eriocheir sinensis]|uniref:cuticle protein AM1159-like n=1 Tax=Eriocheir sinensis TaxID=95602 RepID=UPI0021C640C0|nr:cuticle protein AM1159-like [Eriocheir sinensis]
MKFVLLACLLAVAAARPDKDATITLDERSDSGDGNFYYNVQTSNGIELSKTGTPGSEGQSNMDGSFRFPLEDGTYAEFRYVADENGYRPESSLLPVAPPIPEHVHELLRIAAEQRAQGITFTRK